MVDVEVLLDRTRDQLPQARRCQHGGPDFSCAHTFVRRAGVGRPILPGGAVSGRPHSAHQGVGARQFCSEFANLFRIVAVNPRLVASAMVLAESHILRGYDAVQLAAAASEQCSAPPTKLIAPHLDHVRCRRSLNAAAVAEGLAVDDPNAHPLKHRYVTSPGRRSGPGDLVVGTGNVSRSAPRRALVAMTLPVPPIRTPPAGVATLPRDPPEPLLGLRLQHDRHPPGRRAPASSAIMAP